MKDRDFQTRKEEHGQFNDWIQGTSHKGRHIWIICNFLIKKECVDGHYQNNTRIPTDSNIRNTQGIEDSDNISWTGI